MITVEIMNHGSKPVNEMGGANRYRFLNFAQRVARVDTDILQETRKAFDFAGLREAQVQKIQSHGAAGAGAGTEEDAAAADTVEVKVPTTALDGAPAGGESLFREALSEWVEKDVTQAFVDVVERVAPLSGSTAQLLHHLPQVVAVLLEAIKQPNSPCMPALLSLTATLAREMREELYPHFHSILDTLVEVLDPDAPELTGAVFRTLSLLFRYLSKTLTENLDDVRGYYGRLLGHRRPFVRQFAAESFALLLRRLPSKGKRSHTSSLVKAMGVSVGEARRPEELVDGVAVLLFETVKGAKHTLASHAEDVLPALFGCCRPRLHPDVVESSSTIRHVLERSAASEPGRKSKHKSKKSLKLRSKESDQTREQRDEELASRFDVVARALALLCDHVDARAAKPVWELLGDECQQTFALLRAIAGASTGKTGPEIREALDDDAFGLCAHGSRLLAVLRDFAAHRSGSRAGNTGRQIISDIISKALQDGFWCTELPSATLRRSLLSLMIRSWRLWTRPGKRDSVRDSSLAAGSDMEDSDTEDVAESAAKSLKLVFKVGFAELAEKEGIVDLLLSFSRELLEGPIARETAPVAMPIVAEFAARVAADDSSAAWHTLLCANEVVRRSKSVAEAVSQDGHFNVASQMLLVGRSFSVEFSSGDASSDSDSETESTGDAASKSPILILRNAVARSLSAGVAAVAAAGKRRRKAASVDRSAIVAAWGSALVAARVALPFADCVDGLLKVVDAVDSSPLVGAEATSWRAKLRVAALEALSRTAMLSMSAHDLKGKDQRSAAAGALERIVTVEFRDATLSWLRCCVKSGGALRAAALEAAAAYVETIDFARNHGKCPSDVAATADGLLDQKTLCDILPWMSQALAMAHRPTRSSAIRILSLFDPLEFNADAERPKGMDDKLGAAGEARAQQRVYSGHCDILELLCRVERTENVIETERDRSAALQQVATMLASRRVPPALILAVSRHLLGMFYIPFSRLWPVITATLSTLAAAHPDLAWPAISQALAYATASREGIPAHGSLEKPSTAATAKVQKRSGSKTAVTPMPRKGKANARGVSVTKALRVHSLLRAPPSAEGLAAAFDDERGAGILLPTTEKQEEDVGAAAAADVMGYHHTDVADYFDLVWGVLREATAFAQNQHRTVVPMFLTFLKDDYHRAGRRDDMDAAELGLDDAISSLSKRLHLRDASAKGGDSRKAGRRHRKGSSNGAGGAATDGESPYDSLPVASELPAAHIECSAVDLAPDEAVTGDAVIEASSAAATLTDRRPLGNWASSRRLLTMLRVFAKFRNWDGIVGSPTLRKAFTALLAKPAGGIAAAALECVLAFKDPHLQPYATRLRNIADDDKFREELTKFDVRVAGGVVQGEHRDAVLAVLLRLLLGRLGLRKGRSAKHTLASQRATILAFFGAWETAELRPLLALAMRPFTQVMDADDVASYFPSLLSDEVPSEEPSADSVQRAVASVRVEDVTVARCVGFLRLQGDLVAQLGTRLRTWVPEIVTLNLAVLTLAMREYGPGMGSSGADEEEDGESDGDSDDEADAVAASQYAGRGRDLRVLALQRLSDLVESLPSFDWEPWLGAAFGIASQAIKDLPTTVVGSRGVPALLEFIATVAAHAETVSLLANTPGLIDSVLLSTRGTLRRETDEEGENLDEMVTFCGEGPGPSALTSLFSIIEHLCTYSASGVVVPSSMAATDLPSAELPIIVTYVPQLLDHFCLRLSAAGSKKTSAGRPFAKRELGILCRISRFAVAAVRSEPGQAATAATPSSASAGDLVRLLLPFLVATKGVPAQTREELFETIAALVPILEDPSPLVPRLSKLLGPSRISGRDSGVDENERGSGSSDGRSGGGDSSLSRAALVKVFSALATHPKLAYMKQASSFLEDLNSMSAGIGEIDYERRGTAYTSLSTEVVLTALMDADRERATARAWATDSAAIDVACIDSDALLPIAQHCLFALHDADYSIRSGALQALQSLVMLAAKRFRTAIETSSLTGSRWPRLLDNVIASGIRLSLKSHSPHVRRGCIALLGVVVRNFQYLRTTSAAAGAVGALHLDLYKLLNDDAEADGFMNLAHVQLHRRARALIRLREMCSDTEEPLDGSTVRHVVLPLAMHGVFEKPRSTRAQDQLRKRGREPGTDGFESAHMQNESVALVGAACSVVPWSTYLTTLKMLMSQVERRPDSEKLLVRAVLAVVDAFHYNTARRVSAALAEDGGAHGSDEDAASAANSDEEEAAVKTEADTPNKVVTGLVRIVIPGLRALLGGGGVVPKNAGLAATVQAQMSSAERAPMLRPAVALALVKVIRLLPTQMFHLHLPRTLGRVCSVLRARDQGLRDAGRAVLASVSVVLGPLYLSYVVKELQAVLTDGFAAHVLGHALHGVIRGMVPALTPPAASGSDDDAAAEDLATAAEEEGQTDAADGDASMADGDEKDEEHEGVKTTAALDAAASTWCEAHSKALVDVLPELMDIIMEDVAGKRAEERSSESGYKSRTALKESKTCRSYDTFEILCRVSPFLPSPAVHSLLGPLVGTLESPHRKTKVVLIVREMFRRAVTGLSTNPTVRTPHLLVYVRVLIDDNVGNPGAANIGSKHKAKPRVQQWMLTDSVGGGDKRLRPAKLDSARILPTVKLTGRDRYKRGKMSQASGAPTVVWFALTLLNSVLKRGRIAVTSPRIRSMLEPFEVTLSQLLSTARDNDVLVSSLRGLAYMAQLPLATHSKALPKAAKTVLKLIEQSSGSDGTAAGTGGKKTGSGIGSSRSELCSASLRTLTAWLRSVPSVKVSHNQLRALLVLIADDLRVGERQAAAFNLLRAIISRRLVVPEVYDLMDSVSDMLVRSLRPTARATAARLLVRFLLHYPLGSKRLQQSLEHLVKNMSYRYPDGRLAVLDALHAVVLKLPQPVLGDQAAFLFLPLVSRLVSDSDPQCRATVATVIKLLVRRVGNRVASVLLEFVSKWYDVETQPPAMRRTAAQTLGLLAEVRNDVFNADALEKVLKAVLAELRLGVTGAAAEYDALQGGYGNGVLPGAEGDDVAQDAGVRESQARAEALGDDSDGENERQAGDSKKTPKADDDGWITVGSGGMDLDEAARLAEEAANDRTGAEGAESGSDAGDDDSDDDAAGKRAKRKRGETASTAAVFIPCPKFAGAREGYGFRRGELGVGYYKLDAAQSDALAAAAVISTEGSWSVVYFSLIALGKLWETEGELSDAVDKCFASGAVVDAGAHSPTGNTPLVLLSELLLYPHAWVRLASSRLLGSLLSRVGTDIFTVATCEEAEAAGGAASAALAPTTWLCDREWLFKVARRLCGQLSSEGAGERLVDQAVKNILFVALALHRATPEGDRTAVPEVIQKAIDTAAAVGAGDDEEGEEGDTSGAGADAGAADSEESDNDDDDKRDGGADERKDAEGDATGDGEDGGAARKDPVNWIFHRMSSLARTAKPVTVRMGALRWFAAVAMRLEAGQLAPYLLPAARALFVLAQREPSPDHPAELAALAQEATELVQRRAGAAPFLRALGVVRGARARHTTALKRRRALEVALDPVAAAARRERRSIAKKRQRKNKVDAERRQKGKGARSGHRRKRRGVDDGT